jgi:hypothetical protein
MTSIFEWAKSIYVLWFAPVVLTPQHGWLLPAAVDVREGRTAAPARPLVVCSR